MTLPSGPGDTRPDLGLALALLAGLALLLALPLALLAEAFLRPASAWWATWLLLSLPCLGALLLWEWRARRGH